MAEPGFKLARRPGFTVVYRNVAQDARLSLKARGLYVLMASLPDNWEYTIAGLAAKAGTGKDQVRSALYELMEVGYLVKEQVHGRDGKFARNVFVLQEDAPPLSGNPATGSPTTEKPSTGNPTENNKDKKKKERKPPISPEGEARFQAFWQAYPRKDAKSKAKEAWAKLERMGEVDPERMGAILAAVAAHKRTEQWQREDGRYVPMAATWLNQRRWEDEIQQAVRPTEDDEEGVDGI